VTVYGVDTVSADNWLFNTYGAFGIIGLGPHSYIWEGFTDAETKKASYSIEFFKESYYNEYQKSKITFGATEDPYFAG